MSPSSSFSSHYTHIYTSTAGGSLYHLIPVVPLLACRTGPPRPHPRLLILLELLAHQKYCQGYMFQTYPSQRILRRSLPSASPTFSPQCVDTLQYPMNCPSIVLSTLSRIFHSPSSPHTFRPQPPSSAVHCTILTHVSLSTAWKESAAAQAWCVRFS